VDPNQPSPNPYFQQLEKHTHAPPNTTPTESVTLKVAARWFVIIAAGWYLLRELGPVLKPLFMAVLIAYILLPMYSQVKQRTPRKLAPIVFAILAIGVVILVGLVVQNGIMAIQKDRLVIKEDAIEMINQLEAYFAERSPQIAKVIKDLKESEKDFEMMDSALPVLSVAGGYISSAAVVGLYLLFLLMEINKAPDRVQNSFHDTSARTILNAVKEINRSISQYLFAKVKASLILAIPTTLVLALFEIRLAVFWGALAFFLNFIPYVGAVISFLAPMIFTLLKYKLGWPFWVVGALLITIQGLSSSIIEPRMIGKSVGVSPLVILFFLAFWGFCWGATGMVLAVPLTVMLKIIFANIEATKPLAKLMSDE